MILKKDVTKNYAEGVIFGRIKKKNAYRLIFYFFMAFFILLALRIIKGHIFDYGDFFRLEWLVDVELLRTGGLYQGVFGAQGPFFYFYLYMLQLVVGIDKVPLYATLMNIVANVFIILMITNIVKKETKKDYFFIIVTFYSAIAYYFYAVKNPVISLATLFLLVGYYVLKFSSSDAKKKEIISGILLAVSMFTHAITIPLVIAILFFYLWKKIKSEWKSNVKENIMLPLVVFPIAALFFVLLLLFPKFIYYTILLGSKYQPKPVLQILSEVFFTNIIKLHPFNWLLYFVLLFSFLIFIKRRDVYSFCCSFLLLPVFLLVYRGMGYSLWYFIPYFSFFIIAIVLFEDALMRKLSKAVFFSSIIVFLAGPAFLFMVMDFKMNQIKAEINYPLRFIPQQDGPILSGGFTLAAQRDFLSIYFPHDLSRLDIVITPILPDESHIPGLEYYGLVEDISEHLAYLKEAAYTSNANTLKKITNLSYDLILIMPPYWEELVKVWNSANATETAKKGGYCIISIPFAYYPTREGRDWVRAIMKKHEDCLTTLNKTFFYYREHFASICTKTKAKADSIEKIIGEHTAMFNMTCGGGGRFFEWHEWFYERHDSFDY